MDEVPLDFSLRMQVKLIILSGMLIGRSMSVGAPNMFLKYLDEQIASSDSEFQYKSILFNSVCATGQKIDWSSVDCMLAHTEDIMKQKPMGSTDIESL